MDDVHDRRVRRRGPGDDEPEDGGQPPAAPAIRDAAMSRRAWRSRPGTERARRSIANGGDDHGDGLHAPGDALADRSRQRLREHQPGEDQQQEDEQRHARATSQVHVSLCGHAR